MGCQPVANWAARLWPPTQMGTGCWTGLGWKTMSTKVQAAVLRRVLRPQGLHDVQRFISAAPTLGEREAERLEFHLCPAHTRAEDQTPLTELVNAGEFFREDNGMAVWNDQHGGAKAYPIGDTRQIPQHRDRIVVHRTVTCLNGTRHDGMVRDPHGVKPEILGHTCRVMDIALRQKVPVVGNVDANVHTLLHPV